MESGPRINNILDTTEARFIEALDSWSRGEELIATIYSQEFGISFEAICIDPSINGDKDNNIRIVIYRPCIKDVTDSDFHVYPGAEVVNTIVRQIRVFEGDVDAKVDVSLFDSEIISSFYLDGNSEIHGLYDDLPGSIKIPGLIDEQNLQNWIVSGHLVEVV